MCILHLEHLISCDQCYQWDSTDLSTLPEAGCCLPPQSLQQCWMAFPSSCLSLPLSPGKLSFLFPLDLVKLTRRTSCQLKCPAFRDAVSRPPPHAFTLWITPLPCPEQWSFPTYVRCLDEHPSLLQACELQDRDHSRLLFEPFPLGWAAPGAEAFNLL